jgi:hypothetical protein
MPSTLEAALEYYEMGLSVIPLKKDKRPLISWLPYQQKRASTDEIREWWNKYPQANVGIVTGAISDIIVLDCDSQEAIDSFRSRYKGLTPVAKTPRGMHFYFKYEEGIRNTVKIGNLDMDLRGEGGYVVAPPSINGDGKKYTWHLDFVSSALESFNSLNNLFSFSLKTTTRVREGDTPFYGQNANDCDELNCSGRDDGCLQPDGNGLQVPTGVVNGLPSPQPSTPSTSVYKYFTAGRRDEDLFRTANCLIKGGSKYDFAHDVLKKLASLCSPAFPENEIDAKIKSAIDRAVRRERNLSQEVEDFVLSTTGIFLSTDVDRCLQLTTRDEKKNLSIILRRLADKKIVQKVGDKNGCWRRVDNDPVDFMDYLNVTDEGMYDLVMPLDVHKKTAIMPKSIIILAGVTGFGKSTWLLNVIRDNMHKYEMYLFNSEISPKGMNKKLSYFHYPIDQWKMKVIPDDKWDYNNIADKIYPDAVNVIDYLEPDGDKPFNIHGVITAISKRLDKGIALIALQKNKDREMGVGGVYSAKASSLYLALDWGRITVVKNRYREEDQNPLFNMRDFEIGAGQAIKPLGGWYNEQSKRQAQKIKQYADAGFEDDTFVRE